MAETKSKGPSKVDQIKALRIRNAEEREARIKAERRNPRIGSSLDDFLAADGQDVAALNRAGEKRAQAFIKKRHQGKQARKGAKR